MPLESEFQSKIIKEIKRQYPGVVVLKNDPNYLLGVPDWLFLFENKWAMLETKRYSNSVHQNNQDYYIELFSRMSFASFVNPSNKEQVLDELQITFRPNRPTRFPRR
ncbi:MAG: hypothetical protein US15_C0010G0007 [Candidatus Moranbacteria bacterium GW2011_GWF1_36_4]|nr:MAG: hypothetical protein US15_C0010G0007 [Candidatus Moranbacteria bacterium GW2011_GWF1_36_4]HAQ03037.1 hypothetical protein [Candidatus Nomurabacteria bacterium]